MHTLATTFFAAVLLIAAGALFITVRRNWGAIAAALRGEHGAR